MNAFEGDVSFLFFPFFFLFDIHAKHCANCLGWRQHDLGPFLRVQTLVTPRLLSVLLQIIRAIAFFIVSNQSDKR